MQLCFLTALKMSEVNFQGEDHSLSHMLVTVVEFVLLLPLENFIIFYNNLAAIQISNK